MTDIIWEDSRLRHMLHALTNCHQALWGYCQLGELDKAIAMTRECQSTLTEIRIEIEKQKKHDPEHKDDIEHGGQG